MNILLYELWYFTKCPSCCTIDSYVVSKFSSSSQFQTAQRNLHVKSVHGNQILYFLQELEFANKYWGVPTSQ